MSGGSISNYPVTRAAGSAISLTANCIGFSISDLTLSGAGIAVTDSSDVSIENLSFYYRIAGEVSAAAPPDVVTLTTSKNILVDNILCPVGNSGLMVRPTSCNNVRIRNIPVFNAGFSYCFPTNFVLSGGNNNNISVKNCTGYAFRVAPLSFINSDTGVIVERFIIQDLGHLVHTALSPIINNSPAVNSEYRGVCNGTFQTTGDVATYGSHFNDFFLIEASSAPIPIEAIGYVQLSMNEPTAVTAPYFSITSGVVKFNSSGGVEMRAVGAEAIWEMDYFAKGHTSFRNVAPQMTGGGAIGNFTITYQIDTGSGWNGTWKTLNTSNLTAETISPTTGFKLKIKITTATVNTAAISFLRIYTNSTRTDVEAISYPLDLATVTVTGLVAGSRVKAFKVSDSTVLFNGAESSGSVTFQTDYIGAIIVEARKASAAPFYIPWQSQLTTVANSTVTVTALQQLDQ
jgi:hypothetical protein